LLINCKEFQTGETAHIFLLSCLSSVRKSNITEAEEEKGHYRRRTGQDRLENSVGY
jgi:hypothetical protein